MPDERPLEELTIPEQLARARVAESAFRAAAKVLKCGPKPEALLARVTELVQDVKRLERQRFQLRSRLWFLSRRIET